MKASKPEAGAGHSELNITPPSIRFDGDRPILGCYLLAGDPESLPDQAEIYRESGVDFIEFGLPYEDPFLDGPIIKSAMNRSCASGTSLELIRDQLIETRRMFMGKSIVIVSYGNYDLRALCGCDSAPLFDAHLNLSDLAITRGRVGAPTTSFNGLPSVGFISHGLGADEILEARQAVGYVLLQASPGKTGPRRELDEINISKIRTLRRCGIDLPILLGIGIYTPQQVRAALDFGASGVIMGTRCLVESAKGAAALRRFLKQVRDALDARQ